MEGVSLAKLSATIEPSNTAIAIAYLASRLAENFNVGKKFSTDQALMMGIDLLEVFKHETLEDVVLMFKYARQGKIGDGKDFKLDSQTVFHKWVPAYLELKAQELENQHNRFKGENNINNFNWAAEDVANFKISDSVQTLNTKGTGIGSRKREEFLTSEEKTVHNRKRLESYAKQSSTELLQTYVDENKDNPHSQLAVSVAIEELKTRNK